MEIDIDISENPPNPKTTSLREEDFFRALGILSLEKLPPGCITILTQMAGGAKGPFSPDNPPTLLSNAYSFELGYQIGLCYLEALEEARKERMQAPPPGFPRKTFPPSGRFAIEFGTESDHTYRNYEFLKLFESTFRQANNDGDRRQYETRLGFNGTNSNLREEETTYSGNRAGIKTNEVDLIDFRECPLEQLQALSNIVKGAFQLPDTNHQSFCLDTRFDTPRRNPEYSYHLRSVPTPPIIPDTVVNSGERNCGTLVQGKPYNSSSFRTIKFPVLPHEPTKSNDSSNREEYTTFDINTLLTLLSQAELYYKRRKSTLRMKDEFRDVYMRSFVCSTYIRDLVIWGQCLNDTYKKIGSMTNPEHVDARVEHLREELQRSDSKGKMRETQLLLFKLLFYRRELHRVRLELNQILCKVWLLLSAAPACLDRNGVTCTVQEIYARLLNFLGVSLGRDLNHIHCFTQIEGYGKSSPSLDSKPTNFACRGYFCPVSTLEWIEGGGEGMSGTEAEENMFKSFVTTLCSRFVDYLEKFEIFEATGMDVLLFSSIQRSKLRSIPTKAILDLGYALNIVTASLAETPLNIPLHAMHKNFERFNLEIQIQEIISDSKREMERAKLWDSMPSGLEYEFTNSQALPNNFGSLNAGVPKPDPAPIPHSSSNLDNTNSAFAFGNNNENFRFQAPNRTFNPSNRFHNGRHFGQIYRPTLVPCVRYNNPFRRHEYNYAPTRFYKPCSSNGMNSYVSHQVYQRTYPIASRSNNIYRQETSSQSSSSGRHSPNPFSTWATFDTSSGTCGQQFMGRSRESLDRLRCNHPFDHRCPQCMSTYS